MAQPAVHSVSPYGAPDPSSLDDVARLLFAEGLELPGVLRVGLALVRGAGRELAFTASDRDHRNGIDWCSIDGLTDVPLTRAVRTGAVVRLPDPDALRRGFPELAERHLATGAQAVVAYPLLVDADVVGGLLVCYSSPLTGARPDDDVQEVVELVAESMGIVRERLLTAAFTTRGRGPLRLPGPQGIQLGQHHPLTADVPADAPSDRAWVEVVEVAEGSFVLAAGRSASGDVAHVVGARQAVRDTVAAGGEDPDRVLAALDALGDGVAAVEAAVVAVVGPDGAMRAASRGDARLVTARAAGVRGIAVGSGAHDLAPDDVVILLAGADADATSLEAGVARLLRTAKDPVLLALELGAEHRTSALVVRRVGPASARRAVVDLPHHPSSPGLGRRSAVQLIEQWGAESVLDDARACVSELCTNAFMHSPTPAQMVLSLEDSELLVMVHNGGVANIGPAGGDETHIGGRGLLVVESLSRRWGWRSGAEGTTVWCALPVEP